jgi:beta-phosphoglucomutase-like phosphatase (HAD superfamily)
MPELKAVITDIDGTIAETEDYHRRAYNDLFTHLGLEQQWTPADYAARLTQVGGKKFAEIQDWLGTPADGRAEQKTELYAWKSQRFEELVVADIRSGALPVRPGVLRLFNEIVDAGLVLGAASTCVKPAAVAILEAALGDRLFGSLATICAGDDVSAKKPAPDIFLLAAKNCGIEPQYCLALEDTGHGLRSALAAGMTCVVTPSNFAADDDFSGASAVYATFSDVSLSDLKDL